MDGPSYKKGKPVWTTANRPEEETLEKSGAIMPPRLGHDASGLNG